MIHDLAAADRDELADLVRVYLEQRRAGREAACDEFAAEHPRWAAQLRELLPSVMLLEQVEKRNRSGTAADETPWRLLGELRIVREIGRGARGVVFEAQQVALGRQVALKVLRADAPLDPRGLERFERAAGAVAQLHHRHVAPLLSAGSEAGLYYYLTRYVGGCGLEQVIRQLAGQRQGETSRGDGVAGLPQPEAAITAARLCGGRGYWRNVARLGADAADALAYAHAHGILHQGVKPSNLLLDDEGRVWLTDFGLPRWLDVDGRAQVDQRLDALRYWPPEAVDGRFDERSDVYCLGLALYELCTLRPARDGACRETLIEQVSLGEVAAARKCAADVPRDWEAILGKALERCPQRRYQSAAELRADLERLGDDRPVRARRAGAVERTWRWGRRRPLAASIAALGTVAVAIAAAVPLALATRRRDDALATAQQQQELRRAAERRAEDADTARATAARASAATEERARQVERSLRAAAKAVNSSLTRVGRQQRLDQPGWEPLYQDLLDSALAFYERLGDDQLEDRELDRARLIAYTTAAEAMWELGQPDRALELRRRVDRIVDAHLESRPADADVQRIKAWNALRAGEIHQRLDRPTEAQRGYATAQRLLVRLIEPVRLAPSELENLASMLAEIGRYHAETGDVEQAEILLLASQGAHAELLEGQVSLRQAESQLWLAQALIQRQRYAEGEALARAAASTFARLRKKRPAAADYVLRHAEAIEVVALARSARGRFAEAETLANQAAATLEEAARQHPSVRPLAEGALRRQRARAEVVFDAGRRDEALAAIERVVETLRQGEASRASSRRRDLAAALFSRGRMLLETRGAAAAQPDFEAALAEQARWTAAAADEPLRLRSAALARLELARIYLRAKFPAPALAQLDAARGPLEGRQQAAPQERGPALDVAAWWDARAEALAQSDQADQALAARQRAGQCRSAVPLPEPGDGLTRRLADGYAELALELHEAGYAEPAAQRSRQAVERWLKLAGRASPDTMGRHLGLAIVHAKHAQLSKRLGRDEESKAPIAAGLEAVRAAAAAAPQNARPHLTWAWLLDLQGELAAAAEHLDRAEELAPSADATLFRVAWGYCSLARGAGQRSDRSACDRYQAKALGLLQRVQTRGGLGDPERAAQLRAHRDFDVLRGRADFAELLARLPTAASSAPSEPASARDH